MLAKTLLRNINGVCQNDPDYITLLNQSLTDELFTKKDNANSWKKSG